MKALVLLALAAMIVPAGTRNAAPSGTVDADYSSLPNKGESTEDSYIGNAWQPYTGSKRVSDRSVMVNQESNWGARGSFVNRTYDISSFEISVDVTNVTSKNALIFTFGSVAGSYPTDANHQLNFDIVSDSSDTTKYLVTCSNNLNAHNTSIAGFSDGQTWADDANFTGVTTITNNHTIDIRVEATTDTTTTVYVNEVGYLVANTDIFKNFVDSKNSYITVGTINRPGAMVAYQINYVGDASDKIYFGADGDFTKVKEGIASINNEKATLFESIDGVLQAKEEFDALPYQNLYLHDKAYFKSAYNSLKKEINAKLEEKGAEVYIKVLEKNVTELEEAVKTSTTEEGITNAINKRNAANDSLTSIDVSTLTGDMKLKYDDLVARLNTANTTIKENAPAVYRIKLDEYKTTVENLASIQDVQKAMNLKASMMNSLLNEMSEETSNSLTAELDAATATLNGKTTLDSKNYTQGSAAATFVNEQEELGLLLSGSAMDKEREQASAIFMEEKLAANNFSMTFNVATLPSTSGSWLSFGIMEKPAMFITADSVATQDNKGIFFLLTRKNSTTISIQSYMISLTSNRFYDGVLSQLLEIPMAEDITFSLKEVKKTIAGVEDTFVDIRFNDVSLDQEIIKASKLKTVYGKELQGYLMIASNGASMKDPVVTTIKDINGVSPMADNHEPKEDLTPTTSDSSKSFQLGTTSDVKFSLDTKGQEITEVKVDGTAIDAASYTYENGSLTFKNDYLNTLAEGEHTISVSTQEGSVSWKLTVIAAEKPAPTKKGCKGAALGASLAASIIAVMGMGIALKKKKED